MKRILLIFLSLVLCFSILVIPGFAASDRDSIIFTDLGAEFSLSERPIGLYKILACHSDSIIYESPVLDFDNGFHYNEKLNVYEHYFSFDNSGPDGMHMDINASYSVSDSSFFVFINLCSPDMEMCSMFTDFYDVEYFELSPVSAEPAPDPPAPPSAGAEILPEDVLWFFGDLSTWIISSLGSINGLLWSAGELTVVGFILISFLGVVVVLLLIYIIRKFLGFKG